MVTTCITCGRVIPAGSGGRCKDHLNPARAIRASWPWQRLAKDLKDFHGQCQECGSPGPLEADHIIPASKRPDLALDPGNVRVLCRSCHMRYRPRP